MIAIWWWFIALKFKNSSVFTAKMDFSKRYWSTHSHTCGPFRSGCCVCFGWERERESNRYVWGMYARQKGDKMCSVCESYSIGIAELVAAWICQHFAASRQEPFVRSPIYWNINVESVKAKWIFWMNFTMVYTKVAFFFSLLNFIKIVWGSEKKNAHKKSTFQCMSE